MSPVKTKTQTIAQPTELTAAPVATLLQHSQDGLDTLNEADQHLQTAYAELVEMDVLWPDFTRADLDAAIEEFNHRSRRFGGL